MFIKKILILAFLITSTVFFADGSGTVAEFFIAASVGTFIAYPIALAFTVVFLLLYEAVRVVFRLSASFLNAIKPSKVSDLIELGDQ